MSDYTDRDPRRDAPVIAMDLSRPVAEIQRLLVARFRSEREFWWELETDEKTGWVYSSSSHVLAKLIHNGPTAPSGGHDEPARFSAAYSAAGAAFAEHLREGDTLSPFAISRVVEEANYNLRRCGLKFENAGVAGWRVQTILPVKSNST